MRDAARKMEEKHFSDRTTEHVEFLPVEWRSKLALDGGMIIVKHEMNMNHFPLEVSDSVGCFSDTVDSITPDKVRGLRDMLNSSAMDIMYYTSPLYRDEVRLRLLHTPSFRFPLRNTLGLKFSLILSPHSCVAAPCWQFQSE